MFQFNTPLNKKKNFRKFIYSPFTLFILLMFFLLLLKGVWGVYQKERTSAQYLQAEQDQFTAITSRQKELTQSVDYLKTDQGIEAEIRSKFRVVRDGESVAVIVDDTSSTTVPKTTSTPSIWQRLLGVIGL